MPQLDVKLDRTGGYDMAHPEYTAQVAECASQLRYLGDRLHWRYKLMEMLVHYKHITKY